MGERTPGIIAGAEDDRVDRVPRAVVGDDRIGIDPRNPGGLKLDPRLLQRRIIIG